MRFSVLLALFLVLPIVLGARLQGTVYDSSLYAQHNVRIDVNSTPKQYYISKDGNYQFSLGHGTYKIQANYYENNVIISSAAEEISIVDSGSYILDLVLTPRFDEEEEISAVDDIVLEDQYFEDIPTKQDFFGFYSLIILGFVVLFVVFYFFFFRKSKEKLEKKEESETLDIPLALLKPSSPSSDDLLTQILKFIESQEGRTTQKEVRRTFPSSEAKISLVLTELEAAGKIKKIKKGRGNVIVLVR